MTFPANVRTTIDFISRLNSGSPLLQSDLKSSKEQLLYKNSAGDIQIFGRNVSTVPAGYKKITLNEVLDLVEIYLKIPGEHMQFEAAIVRGLEYMGQHKTVNAGYTDSGILAIIRLFLSRLENFLTGRGYQTSAQRAKVFADSLNNTSPPPPQPPQPPAAAPPAPVTTTPIAPLEPKPAVVNATVPNQSQSELKAAAEATTAPPAAAARAPDKICKVYMDSFVQQYHPIADPKAPELLEVKKFTEDDLARINKLLNSLQKLIVDMAAQNGSGIDDSGLCVIPMGSRNVLHVALQFGMLPDGITCSPQTLFAIMQGFLNFSGVTLATRSVDDSGFRVYLPGILKEQWNTNLDNVTVRNSVGLKKRFKPGSDGLVSLQDG